MWNLFFLLISHQQVAYTFTIKFIKLWSFVVSLCGYAPRDHKHMSLMAKVNHLAKFKGPIFQEAYLESTLPLEIPTAFSYRSLWSQLRSCVSSVFKIESRGLLRVENDIWGKSWPSFEHNFHHLLCMNSTCCTNIRKNLCVRYLLSSGVSFVKVKWHSVPLVFFIVFCPFSSTNFPIQQCVLIHSPINCNTYNISHILIMFLLGSCFHFSLCPVNFTFINNNIIYINPGYKKAHSLQIQKQGIVKAGSKIRRYVIPD